jgi:hypothetical protein
VTIALAAGRSRATMTPSDGGRIGELSLGGSAELFPAQFDAEPGFGVGGWQTMFPNAGARATLVAEQPPHGTAFHGRWNRFAATRRRADLGIRIGGYELRRAVRLGRRTLTVEDRVASRGSAPYLYGHHVTFDDDGSSVVAVGKRLRRLGTVAELCSSGREVRALRAQGTARLVGADRAIRLNWTREVLPFVWIWVTRVAERYVVGIEPVSVEVFGGLDEVVRDGGPERPGSAPVRARVRLTVERPPHTIRQTIVQER